MMPAPVQRLSLSRCELALLLLFVCTLPLVNPWVRGDGVGYYAYTRSLLIDGDLRFDNEWLAGNPTFRMGRVNPGGQVGPQQYTRTGYVANHWSVGPAILWAPFLIVAHGVVRVLNGFGAAIPADGYSWPYTVAMALATAVYGFAGLGLSFRLARNYFEERWAALGMVGVWFASSLPVYMYLNPSWAHAHSAFAVALFLWYWHRTRDARSVSQWVVLGLISGLMLNVYYPHATLLLVPLVESLGRFVRTWRAPGPDWPAIRRLVWASGLYLLATLVAFLPTLITRKILFGTWLTLGYYDITPWNWETPALGAVLFSANHGLLTWTPILLPALLGLVWLYPRDRNLTICLGATVAAFYLMIALYPDWHGISSFGNRFFVSLTPIFVLGLTAWFSAWGQWVRSRGLALATASLATALLVVWNVGFIFQWATRMVDPRGPVSWRQVAYNQVVVVPGRLVEAVERYLASRRSYNDAIEQEDFRKLKSADSPENQDGPRP